MQPDPSLILFDVNETLSDTSSLSARFAEVGVPAELAQPWFAVLLRDGFALAAAGGSRPFAEVGADALRSVLHSAGTGTGTGTGTDTDLDRAAEHVLGAFGRFPLHDDVAPGLRALRRGGRRLATLTNGSRAVSEQLLTAAGVREEFEALLSVEDAATWKPGPAAYRHALRSCGVEAADVLLVAVHPWDLHGAAAAGLATAWIDRNGAPYPRTLTAPTVRATSLVDLAEQLA